MRRQIRIEEAERVRWLDHAHAGGALLLDDLIAERLHPGPMHLRPEMMLGVVAVVEPDPVVELVVAAHAPGDRLVGIAAVVPVVAVQIGKAVAEVIKRKKETNVVPVQNAEDDEGRDEKRQLRRRPRTLRADSCVSAP